MRFIATRAAWKRDRSWWWSAYLRCLPSLKKIKLEGHRQVGWNYYQGSWRAIRQIVENAGRRVQWWRKKWNRRKGLLDFDADKEEYTDILRWDHRSDKGSKIALQNAPVSLLCWSRPKQSLLRNPKRTRWSTYARLINNYLSLLPFSQWGDGKGEGIKFPSIDSFRPAMVITCRDFARRS